MNFSPLINNDISASVRFLLDKFITNVFSNFTWPFLRPYMGVIPNPKIAFFSPISLILILFTQFQYCEGKGSLLKSQIKSLVFINIFKPVGVCFHVLGPGHDL